MGAVIGAIFSIYFFIVIISSPYFWWKKTDRSQAPIVRRAAALGYGLIWPYLVYQHFAGKQQPEFDRQRNAAMTQRILGDGPDSSSAGGGFSKPGPSGFPTPGQADGPTVGSTPRNPYDR